VEGHAALHDQGIQGDFAETGAGPNDPVPVVRTNSFETLA